MPLTAAKTAMKACAGMSLRAMICLVAFAMVPVSWGATPNIPARDNVTASVSTALPGDRKAVSSTTSHDFIRSGVERRTLSVRFDDPLGDDMPAGLPAGFATVSGPDGISTVPMAAASELHPARHIRPAATGPPDAA